MAYIGQSLTEGTRREYSYVATASQTTFNAIYTVGAVDVYQNGVLLAPSDYTATTGTTVVFNTGAALNDEITIHCHNTFSVADTVSASQGGTFSGAVVANDGLTVNNDAATVLTVDRATSEGTLVDFKKDGITVGNLGVGLSSLSVGTGNTQLLFWNAQSGIFPSNGATVTDNSIDFGNPNYRFKDLYLSGGVYLGGTGAANLLDDYEEGTWTPNLILQNYGTIGVLSGYGGRYTRIGKTVFFNLYGRWNTSSRAGVQETRVSLPFTCKAANGGYQTYAAITVSYLSAFIQNQSTYIVGGYVEDGQPHLRLHIFQGNSELPITDTYLSASSSAGIMISGQYDIE